MMSSRLGISLWETTRLLGASQLIQMHARIARCTAHEDLAVIVVVVNVVQIEVKNVFYAAFAPVLISCDPRWSDNRGLASDSAASCPTYRALAPAKSHRPPQALTVQR